MQLEVSFFIPEEITQKLDTLGVSKEQQKDALYEAIYLHIQERFLVDEEEDIIEHVVDYES